MNQEVVRYHEVCDGYNLQRAWMDVRGSRTAAARHHGAGVDGATVADWEANWQARLRALQGALQDGSYRPSPLLRFDIPRRRPSPSHPAESEAAPTRRLGIPTVTDRVVQRAVKNALEPTWEAQFLSCSHGYRPERSVYSAVVHVLWHEAQGLSWVADGDIEACFDTIRHDFLLELLSPTADDDLLDLIAGWLVLGAAAPGLGIAQGAVLSPLLANVYLHPFDVAMIAAGLALVRFADDWVVMSAGPDQALSALEQAAGLLAELGLSLNPDKTGIVPVGPELAFLGAQFE